MQHDFDPYTLICKNCLRTAEQVRQNYLACESRPARLWTPDLTDALAEIYRRVVTSDDTTPDLIVEPPPCSEPSSPPFGV